MSFKAIKNYLKFHDPTYHVLLNNHTDQPNTRVIPLIDDVNFRRILGDSEDELKKEVPEPSTSGNSMPEDRYVDKTTVNPDDLTKRCPDCLYDFKSYGQHKNHKTIGGCCLCRKKFNSDTELREHVRNYAAKFVCCVCANPKPFNDCDGYYNHIKNYCYRKHKTE